MKLYARRVAHPTVVDVIRSASSQLVGTGRSIDGSGENRRGERDEGSKLDKGEHCEWSEEWVSV